MGLRSAPQVAVDRRCGVDVARYAFRIELPDSGTLIRGDAMVWFTRRPGWDDTLRLDLVGMTVDSVRDGATGDVLPFRYDGRLVSVATASADGDTQMVRLTYHGSPADGLIIRPNARGRRSVFADNWPNRARHWLPTADHPGDKAGVRWFVSAPAGSAIVANGQRLMPDRLDDGRATASFVEDRPIPTYAMVVGVTQMTVSRHRPAAYHGQTVPISVWAYPEDSAFADSVPFRRATGIVEAMSRMVGPFPYGSLAHVQSSTRYGGMENSTAIFYSEQSYLRRSMDEGVVRHETAHQWFGDAVTPREWPHLWLSEGFASYFDGVIGAALDGDSVLARVMRENKSSYLRSRVVDRPILDTTVGDPNLMLNANNYQKGAWVLHMLRGLVGDSAFFRGVRAYYRRYRDSSVVSDRFQREMELASGRRLDWFFAQWLRQPGFPRLEVRWSADSARRRVTLRVRQEQPVGWGRFRLPSVPVTLVLGDGRIVRRSFALDDRRLEQEVGFSLSRGDGVPASLAVDPDDTLLLTATVSRERP